MADKFVDKFDELAVSLSNGGSRRLIVRRLALSALSALGALGVMSVAEDEAEANGAGIGGGRKPRKPGRKPSKPKRPKKCPKGRKRCGKVCCSRNKVCKQGKCRKRGVTPCKPNCTGKECGNDGCGGSCGPCTAPDTCQPDNTCQCIAKTRQEACVDPGFECGEVPDGCDGPPITCGPCPDVPCQTLVGCSSVTGGTCQYEKVLLQGTACDAGTGPGTGVCAAGTCYAMNADPAVSCAGVNVCNTERKCGTGTNDCNCYSTWEDAGFCVRKDQAICPAESVRPSCSSSTQCAGIEGHANSVCVPLLLTSDSQTGCCIGGQPVGDDQWPGFCVPIDARCGAII